MLRGQLADIVFGAVFLFIGLAACFIAAIRPRSGVRLLILVGIWSAMYGTGLLARSPAVVAALPLVLQTSVPYVNTLIAYLLAVVAMSAFLELSRGGIRLLIKILILAEVVVAVVGIGWFAVGRWLSRQVHLSALACLGLRPSCPRNGRYREETF
jgi:hypothetical protein